MNLEVNKWLVLLYVLHYGPSWLVRTQWSSRTLEWEDAGWENGDPLWPEFFLENAL